MFVLLIVFLSLPNCLAQQHWYKYDEVDSSKSRFFIGVNVAAFFTNAKTAGFYSGTPAITQFGVEHYLFDRQDLQQTFRDYFVHPYNREEIEYPLEPRYKTSVEIGLHVGYHLSNSFALYLDLNTVQLRYDQFVSIAIRDPQNANTLEPKTFVQLPLIGRETRFNLNLGTQISYYQEGETNAYFNFFGNLNGVQLSENYFVVNEVEYQIQHPVNDDFNQTPGGIGYGAGGGLGLKFGISEHVSADLFYQVYYQQINLSENLQPYGYNHSLGMRVIWH